MVQRVNQETLTKVQIDDPAFIQAAVVCGPSPCSWCCSASETEPAITTVQAGQACYGRCWHMEPADFWANCDFGVGCYELACKSKHWQSEIWFGSAGLSVSSPLLIRGSL